MTSFKEQFIKIPPGQERENLIYQYAINQGKPKTVPMEVKQPNGDIFVYHVMPDYLMIEGMRVPMTGPTAERIARHFGMTLPTADMNQKIYQEAVKRKGALTAKPLSGSNVKYEGKTYTGKDVVRDVSKSELTPVFNAVIESDPVFQAAKAKGVDFFAGHMKTIVAPDPNGPQDKLWLHGLYDKNGKPIQGGWGETPHDLSHAEYASGARFIDSTHEIIHPSGKKDKGKFTPPGSYLSGTSKTPGPPKGTVGIKDLPQEIKEKAQELSKQFLSLPMWTEKQIDIDGVKFIAKVEPHSNKPKGVSLYRVINQPAPTPKTQQVPSNKPSTSVPQPSAMQKIQDKLDELYKKIF